MNKFIGQEKQTSADAPAPGGKGTVPAVVPGAPSPVLRSHTESGTRNPLKRCPGCGSMPGECFCRPCGCRTTLAGRAICEERTGSSGSYCLHEAQSDDPVSKP